MIEVGSHLVYFFIVPNVLFYFYSRCCFKPYVWYKGVLYTVLAFGIVMLNLSFSLPSVFLLTLKVFLLAACGNRLLHLGYAPALSLSSLVISIHYLADGFMQSVAFGIVSLLSPEQSSIMEYMDLLRHTAGLFFIVITFIMILKYFSDSLRKLHHSAWLLLAVPLLFISLVEQIISASLYGNTVVWDSERGMVFPIVNHMELIVLHVLAWIGMSSTLIIFHKLVTALQNEQIVELLKLKARAQADYAREAQARYNQTRAFRHDVRNHFIVLQELLASGDLKQANVYLSKLKNISDVLSFSVQTNHVVADALLGSKLAVAEQEQVQITCEVHIPSNCKIQDLDWCVLLANAVDNAMSANRLIAADQRYIRIYGKEKGNLYFLQVENACKQTTEYPAYGIGLSNIAAVVQKYQGELEIEVTAGKFVLNLLLVTS